MSSKRSRQAFEADLQRQESPYVQYGTPLPPLDGHIRDDGSFVPVWKQEVTDDRGRKRLHGAFTGGFSAGYYNTVGSKEGWTPSTFVSSRKDRAKDTQPSKQMRPEDFMDKEDLREAEESRHLETADTFSGFGTDQDPRRRDALIDLFRPAADTVGIRLLKVMGWREDAPDTNGQSSNAPIVNVTPPSKHDRKGLGFDDESNPAITRQQPDQHEAGFAGLRDSSRLSREAKPKKDAFGVGVLNDNGSDEEDPYAMGPLISYNRVLGGDKKQKKKAGTGLAVANPTLKSKPGFLSKKLANMGSALRKCHDGRLPPDGFVLADDLEAMASLSLQAERYRPPEVPSSWKSALAAEGVAKEQPLSVAGVARKSMHNAKTRADALGEDLLPGKSVFDFISPSARNRLAQASGRTNLPPGLGERPANGTTDLHARSKDDLQDLVPKLEQSIAIQALQRGDGGWMPYAEDESKRQRYRIYLEIRAGLRQDDDGDELPLRAENMSQEQWIVELQEFARAAHVFKPVTGDMATRFTSSTSSQPSSTNPDSSVGVDSLLTRPKEKPQDPAEAAARMGLFGQVTRSISNFYPTRLVCKRFNVSMPEHSNLPQQSPASQVTPELAALLGKSRFQSVGFQKDDTADPDVHVSIEDRTEVDGNRSKARLEAGNDVNSEKNPALEQEKPSRALFKAIFGSEDEDD